MISPVKYVTSTKEVPGVIEDLLSGQPVIGLDIETLGLDPHTAPIRLVSAATVDGKVGVFDVAKIPITALTPLTERQWVTFNGGFETRFFAKAGIVCPPLHDLQLLDRLISNKMYRGLKDVVKDTLGISMDKTLQVSEWSGELSDEQIKYSGMDALWTVQAAAKLLPQVDGNGQRILYDTWRKALPILAHSSLTGLSFDVERHIQLIDEWRQELMALQEVLQTTFGNINPGSSKQLGEWLQQNVPSKWLDKWPLTDKGALKTGKDALGLHADFPPFTLLLKHKAISKLLNTYGTKFSSSINPVTGRIHPSFNIGQTKTGRLTSDGPNVHNLPKKPSAFRDLFVPDPSHVFIKADYSQIELRVAALLSQDNVMLDAYRRGVDLHRLTAASHLGIPVEKVTKEQRQSAKAINFGNLYGQASYGLSRYAKASYQVDMTVEEAQSALNTFSRTYPMLDRWKTQQVGRAMQFGNVRTRLGLVRDFIKQGFGYLKGEACNVPIQGSSAEILITTITKLPEALHGLDARLYNNIHDELIISVNSNDADQAKRRLQDVMVDGFLTLFPEAEYMSRDLVEIK